MNSVQSNNLSFKWQMFTPSDLKNIGIRNFKFVSKTQFLCKTLNVNISIFHEKIILSNLSKKVSHMHPPFRRKGGAPYPLHPPLVTGLRFSNIETF